jgi:hypothetical protein
VTTNNPPTKSIDVLTQKGLDLLKEKAKYYGHYAEALKVAELISQVENLRKAVQKTIDTCPECRIKFLTAE